MALGKLTPSDIKYRLNKLKCCFASKAAELAEKQQYGKPCDDEFCNLEILGAYIEIIECYEAEPCVCTQEWENEGSKVWTQGISYAKSDVVKVIPRAGVSSPDEYLFFKWLNLVSTVNFCASSSGFISPCYGGLLGINANNWSVCGHTKEAWLARGSLYWDSLATYQYGDIVKFNGGGIGLDQTGIGKIYISITDVNIMNTGFHESGHWVELECFEDDED